jgi:hypothetical protein
MKLQFFIIFAIATWIGFVGFLSFVLVRRNGGWANAMKRTDDGSWPPARCLMLVGAALGVVLTFLWFLLSVIPGGLPWTKSSVDNAFSQQLVGEWEMADGSDYVIEFTRDGTMRIRNHAGEPQVLMAGDEILPFRMLSESVVGIPNRSLMMPENLVAEEEGYFFVFAISIEQDRLTIRGQTEGETIILSQDGVTKVRFPGSNTSPLEFMRRQ